MPERIEFIFDGQLAAQNQMDFYESSRFQYAAARLAVKLDRFRKFGSFPKRVTWENNSEINLKPFRAGSFGIEIVAPALAIGAQIFLEVPLTALWTYVIERVFKPALDEDIRAALQTQNALLEVFNNHIAGTDDRAARTLDLLRMEVERDRALTTENSVLRDRLLAEAARRAYLEGRFDILRQITPEQDANLVTMAAPLLKELSVPMRRSASRATIRTEDQFGRRDILNVDRKMTEEVELTTIDPSITTMSLNIIQYNKENGWGKFRNNNWQGIASFAIPADQKAELQPVLLEAMNQDEVYVQAYFVRSLAGVQQRIIIVDFIELSDMEIDEL